MQSDASYCSQMQANCYELQTNCYELQTNCYELQTMNFYTCLRLWSGDIGWFWVEMLAGSGVSIPPSFVDAQGTRPRHREQ